MRKDFYPYYFTIEDQHWWFVGRRKIFLSVLDEALADRGSGAARQILDVGCGTGTMVGHLGRYGDVLGVDTDPDAIRFCHQRGVTSAALIDGDSLPFENGSFDLVTALDVLEHVDDDRALLSEMRRILKPDGLAVVSVPAYRALWGAQDEVSHHKRRYTATELEQRLVGAGLRPRRLTYFNTLLFPPIAAIRLARRLLPAPAELHSDFEMTTRPRSNRLLATIFGTEARLLSKRDFPFGISILGVGTPQD